ncbi:GTP-binding protein RbgA [Fructobacillus ficulneus]|uniref:GTP-binding protein RbgA n=1 Tax=Fructobacillus ficulneus TaxID=157463 RepID=A0A0K8MJR4_9LACO|nr:GTP-binding protein RbgA [Fructobacillus ficulneus]
MTLLGFFRTYNPQAIIDRYHLAENAYDQSDVDLLMNITAKLGFKDDYEKASVRILNDLRQGKLGTYTLDLINE